MNLTWQEQKRVSRLTEKSKITGDYLEWRLSEIQEMFECTRYAIPQRLKALGLKLRSSKHTSRGQRGRPAKLFRVVALGRS